MQVQSNAQAMSSRPTKDQLESWEDDGGATRTPTTREAAAGISGNQNQIEWAEQIKARVDEEFHRVAGIIQSKAKKRDLARRKETDALLSILRSGREEVLASKDAIYRTPEWKNIDDREARSVLSIEWANQIKAQVNAVLDQVSGAIQAEVEKQEKERQRETDTLLAILETKREEVMTREDAGYFIHDWQDIDDQVSRLIRSDKRYLAIKSKRIAQGGRLRRLRDLESKGKA